MNVLVTGANGFIGKAVTHKMDEQGISWTSFHGDILVADGFKDYDACDVVLHLAGITRAGSTYEEQKHLLDVNIIGTMHALDFARAGMRRFLFASTCSYGNPAKIPIPESEPITYHNPYSYSKWNAEHAISVWHKFFGLEGVIFRIFNVYGPEQAKGFLIPDIISNVKDGKLQVFNLSAIRDFIYIDDVVNLMVCAITSPSRGLITVNAGSGDGKSIRDVIKIVFELMQKEIPLEDLGLPENVPVSIADIAYAKKVFNWHPAISLKNGIAHVLAKHGLWSAE